MSSQKYRAWKPVEGIPQDLWVEAIHDDVEGLRFLLRGRDPSSPTLRLFFESIVGYRVINESFRIKTWANVPDIESLPSLMTVENSSWLKWIVEEAGGVLQPDSLTHFAIYTPEDCIDVATQFPPIVDWPNR